MASIGLLSIGELRPAGRKFKPGFLSVVTKHLGKKKENIRILLPEIDIKGEENGVKKIT